MQKLKIAPLALSILVATMPGLAQANQPKTPYLANPMASYRYLNRTVPNIAIIVDNSNIMNTTMPTKNSQSGPRHIDVVKAALLSGYPDARDATHNISLVTLTDVAKDMHWKMDGSQSSGYLFAPGIGKENIFYSNEPNFDPYNTKPVSSNGTLQRSVGSGDGKQNYGFNRFKGSTLIGDVQTSQEYVPGLSETEKNTIGMTLLVPLLKNLTNEFDLKEQNKELELLTKTITLSDGKMRDVLPNTIEYLADNINYRCQESYALVITNDIAEVMDEVNLEAVGRYSQTHPKSSSDRDKEGQLYNQLDFPNQYIKTYLLALNMGMPTDKDEFLLDNIKLMEFGAIGGGGSVSAIYPHEVFSYINEFMHEMKSSKSFLGAAPAVYVGTNPKTGEELQKWVYGFSQTQGWFGNIQIKNGIHDDKYESFMYAAEPTVYLNAGRDLVFLQKHNQKASFAKDRNVLRAQDFNLKSNENVEEFIDWLIGMIPENIIDNAGDDVFKNYRMRSSYMYSEKRYLGDITSDTIEIMGSYRDHVQGPRAVVVGSNDGMLKIYTSNLLYKVDAKEDLPGYEDFTQSFPYVNEFAYLPGAARRSDGSTLMENLKYRADPRYGEESPDLVHEYGISGQIAYRTTNNGQNFLVSSIGQGGFGAFALNISGNAHENQNNLVGVEGGSKKHWAETAFLWDTNSDAFGDAKQGSDAIGHISGRPVISRIAMSRSGGLPNMKSDVRYVAVLPSGEFGDQTKDSGPTLYIYDAIGVNVALGKDNKDVTPGKLIKKVTAEIPKGVSLKYKNSLSAPTLVDLTFDGVADVGYVGDLNGHLYRLDLRGDKASDWKLEMIYEGSHDQPITQAPSVSRYDRKNVVVFGTGSYNKKDDFKGSYPQQAIYGIFEDDNFTGFKDGPLNSQSNFLEQTLSTNMNDDARSISNNEIEKEHDGWRIALSRTASEALAQKPIVFNGTLFFQTYVLHEKGASDHAMCYRPALSPDTWLFQINARTGGILGEDTDTRLEEMGREHVIQFDSVILPTLKLVRTDESSSTSKDGEMQNGNDPDFDLIELESLPSNNVLRKSHYLNKEGDCNAIMTNGMTLTCEPFEEILEPGRISIMKRNAQF